MTRSAIPDASRYVPALDGVRAVAVALVILSHFGLERVVPGGFGVTIFFWLSGFLITTQLLTERANKGRIDLWQFYVRRILRLIPAAFVYITLMGVACDMVGVPMPWLGWASSYFYSANYYDLYVGFPALTTSGLGPLGHLWSLAVEEHFYILWPPLLVLLAKPSRAGWALVAVCVGTLIWRAWLYPHCEAVTDPGGICGRLVEYRFYKATDTRLDSIAWGGLFAIVAASGLRPRLEAALRSRRVLAVAFGLLLITFLIRNNNFREVERYTLQSALLCVFVPIVCTHDGWIRRMLEWRLSVYVGRLSYSLYLWHWAAVIFSDWVSPKLDIGWYLRAIGMTVIGALLSYYLVERPMIALRRKVGSHATTAIAGGD